jgi:hypothetical protein
MHDEISSVDDVGEHSTIEEEACYFETTEDRSRVL